MSFEKGDTVVLYDENSEFDGMTGDILQVTETMFGDFIYTIQFDEGRETGISEDIIDAVETDDGSRTSGPTGVGAPSEAMSRTDSGADPTEPGTEEWAFETGGSVESSPTVVDGTVYVGSRDNNLYAVDAANGREEWAFETGDSIKSSPTVINGTVYVGSYDHHLYAVNAESGREEWTFDTGANIYSSPTVINGTVYVGWCSHPDSRDDHLYAVDAKSGRKEWTLASGGGSARSFETAFNKSYDTPTNTPPTVVAGVIYFGCRDSHLYAVDTHGKQKWRFETEGWLKSSPTVADGIVYAGSLGGILYAVDAASGHKEWGFETGFVEDSPVVADGTVYVGNNDLYAVDIHSGQQEWRSEGVQTSSSPMVVDGTAYVGGHDGTLCAVDTESGREEWAFEAGGNILSSPTVADGTVYLGSSEGSSGALHAVAATGDEEESSSPKLAASDTAHGGPSEHAPITEAQTEQVADAETSPPRRPSLSPEDLTIVKEIGAGGQAIIKEARVPEAQHPPARVAVREPDTSATLTREAVEEFCSQTELWATIDARERKKQRWDGYEHIVGVIATGDRQPWVAMEYMNGGDLEELLAEHPDGLPVGQALWTGECVCKGLEIAHNLGHVHLDVKPGNVLLKGTDGWPWPKIADWGLARMLATETGTMEGLSVEYAGPEQFDSGKFGDPDQLTDIYQTGTLVYALLTGNPPATGGQLEVMNTVIGEEPIAPPSERRADLPPAVDAAVGVALERQKTDRYSSVSVFGDALHALRTGGQLPPAATARLDE
jgi:outer membrane protein assembly factor BamB